MSRIEMFSDEIGITRWEPFHGLPGGVVPDVSIAGGEWQPMTLDATYGTALPADDPDKTADWFKIQLTGVNTPTDAVGIVVPVGWSAVVFRAQSAGTTDIKPDRNEEPLWLVVTRRPAASLAAARDVEDVIDGGNSSSPNGGSA